MKRPMIIGISLFLFGIVAGANLPSPNTNHPNPTSNLTGHDEQNTSLTEQNQPIIPNFTLLTELNTKINTEIKTREQLTHLVLALQEQIETLQHQIPKSQEMSEDISKTSFEVTHEDNQSTSPADQAKTTLMSLGLDESRIASIARQAEETEMAQLFLRDKAIREDWMGTERYAQERQALQSNQNVYREELGDNNYDQYLFKTGESNRVGVQSILASSPAEKVGIQAGDVIYSYDGQRIFTWSDLTSATAAGEAEETVKLTVRRNQQSLDIYLPRGPLGIRLNAQSVDPDPAT